MVKAVSLIKDGKKGLGFTIERGEMTRGSAAVLVAGITRGGPAEVEGTLQVGDQILNVDGQKILGYAYDKVKLMGMCRVAFKKVVKGEGHNQWGKLISTRLLKRSSILSPPPPLFPFLNRTVMYLCGDTMCSFNHPISRQLESMPVGGGGGGGYNSYNSEFINIMLCCNCSYSLLG